MTTATAALLPGFADPVTDAQICFRAVLGALAHPGVPQDLATDLEPPPGLTAEQCCVLLTLADYETPVWLAPSVNTPETRNYLAFHCGAPLASNVSNATYVVLGSEAELPVLEDLSLGVDAYPDRSATLILRVSEFGSGHTLTGPGIEDTLSFDAEGLSDRFWVVALRQHDLGVAGP